MVVLKNLEHLSGWQLEMAPELSTSTKNRWMFPSELAKTMVILSPLETVIVGPGIVLFQPVKALPSRENFSFTAFACGMRVGLAKESEKRTKRTTTSTVAALNRVKVSFYCNRRPS